MSFYDSLNKYAIGWMLLFLFASNPTDAFNHVPISHVAAFVVGILFQFLMECFFRCLRNNNCMIRKALASQRFKQAFPDDASDEYIKDQYYTAYYALLRYGMLGNVTILEALERFLKSCIIISLLYLVCLTCGCERIVDLFSCLGTRCTMSVSLVLAIIFMLKGWYHYQLTIHKLVWEGKHYLDCLEKCPKVENAS